MAGGYNSVQGIMDDEAARRDPQGFGNERNKYNPNASETDNTATGLAAFGEAIGTASSYRSPGYNVDENAGRVGGSLDASQQNQQQYQGLAQNARVTATPYVGQYFGGMNDAAGARGYQQGGLGMTANAAEMYRQMALGNGPSLAQAQMQQGLQQAQAQQASMAAGARGGGANLAAAQLAASTMAGQQAAATNEAMGRARIQEQLGAMQGYGGLAGQYGALAGQMRGQDYQGAGMGMQANQFQQGLATEYEKMRQQQQLAELGAQTGLEQTQGQLAIQRQGQLGQQNQAAAQEGSGLFAGALGGLSSIFKSDERTKTDIRDASEDIDARLERLRPLAWRYKDDESRTEKIGPMAQQMPDSTVVEIGGVKHIKVPEAVGFGLAAIARLNERLRKVEGK